MATTGRGRARSEKLSTREADRRRTILRAAVEVFARKGYHGCRIADVAREAKVAYGLVYHYFQNKDELLRSVFEAGWQIFHSAIQEVVRQPATLEEKVHGIAHVAFEAYRQDPRAVKVLILEIGRSQEGGRINRGSAFIEMIRLATEMFEEARRKGELSPDLDPVLAATLLFGALEMGLTTFVLGVFDRRSDEALDRAKEQVANTFLRGALNASYAEAAWKSDRPGTRSKVARRS